MHPTRARSAVAPLLLLLGFTTQTLPSGDFPRQIATGTVTAIDPRHGNVYTTIKPADYERLGLQPGQVVRLNLADKPPIELTIVRTYTDVEVGQPAAVLHREGLTFAIRDGRFADAHGVAKDTPFVLWGK